MMRCWGEDSLVRNFGSRRRHTVSHGADRQTQKDPLVTKKKTSVGQPATRRHARRWFLGVAFALFFFSLMLLCVSCRGFARNKKDCGAIEK